MVNYNFIFYVNFLMQKNIKYNFISPSPHRNSVRKVIIIRMLADEETEGIKGQHTL